MPDGDIIRGLQRIYQKPYEALFGRKATNDECIRSLIKSLLRDIKNKGDIPINLAKRMHEIITQFISNAGGIIFVDWAVLRRELNRLVEQSDGAPNLKELALRAGINVIQYLEYGVEVDICNISVVIVERYFYEVYESEFKERIPLDTEHHNGIYQSTLLDRIEEIQPKINIVINKWAKEAIKNQSVAKLSLPRRSFQKVIDMDEDLLAG